MIFFKDDLGQVHAFYDDVDEKWFKDLRPMTPEEIEAHLNPPKNADQIYAEWKTQRQALVDAIEVEFNGVIYQGDLNSQSLLATQIASMADDETTAPWTAKDNQDYPLNRVQLRTILADATAQKNAIWNVGRPVIEAPEE